MVMHFSINMMYMCAYFMFIVKYVSLHLQLFRKYSCIIQEYILNSYKYKLVSKYNNEHEVYRHTICIMYLSRMWNT